jgi:hypothetical protein
MHQLKNNRRLAKQLVAHVCARPAIIVDLCDAAAFIDMHGGRTRLWVTAETAVKCADHNPARSTRPPGLSKMRYAETACSINSPASIPASLFSAACADS